MSSIEETAYARLQDEVSPQEIDQLDHRRPISTDAAYEARSSGDDALVFVGEHSYSPVFYSRGKAEQLNDMAELAERLRSIDASNSGRGKVFVALRDRQDRELPRELRERLHFQGRFDVYELYELFTLRH